MKEKDPYMEGYEAYMNGQNREDNPHEFSTLAEEAPGGGFYGLALAGVDCWRCVP